MADIDQFILLVHKGSCVIIYERGSVTSGEKVFSKENKFIHQYETFFYDVIKMVSTFCNNPLDHRNPVQVSDPKDKTSPTVPGMRAIQRSCSDDTFSSGASTQTGSQHSPRSRCHSSRQLESVYAGNLQSLLYISQTIDFVSNGTATAVGGKDFL